MQALGLGSKNKITIFKEQGSFDYSGNLAAPTPVVSYISELIFLTLNNMSRNLISWKGAARALRVLNIEAYKDIHQFFGSQGSRSHLKR